MPINRLPPSNNLDHNSIFYSKKKQPNIEGKVVVKEYELHNKSAEEAKNKVDKVRDRIVTFEKDNVMSVSEENEALKNKDIKKVEIINKDTGVNRSVSIDSIRIRTKEESLSLINELMQCILFIEKQRQEKKTEKEDKPASSNQKTTIIIDQKPQVDFLKNVTIHLRKEETSNESIEKIYDFVSKQMKLEEKQIEELKEEEKIKNFKISKKIFFKLTSGDEINKENTQQDIIRVAILNFQNDQKRN